jgi:hypothetical protein
VYTAVAVFLVLLALLIYFYLTSRKEGRRMKKWLASQPPEVVISRRQKVEEKARALLQEQINCKPFFDDCNAFFYEFGQSQDPKIRELAVIAEGFVHENDEFRDSVESLIIGLRSAKDKFSLGNGGAAE